MDTALQRGAAAASASYIIWGLLPIYWKALKVVAPFEILAHRMAWSMPFAILFLYLLGRGRPMIDLHNKQALGFSALSSSLLAVNWLIYIWAVNSGYILEASLGYYINPLVSVCFGMVFMQERLRSAQVVAVILAGLGVIYLTFVYGRFPWIGLALAITFGIYGLLHKKISIGPLHSLHLETLIFFVPATLFLVYLEWRGTGVFMHGDWSTTTLLIGTGLITTVPLLLFGYAAQKIPLILLGILQYTAPTLNLLLGIFVYGEDFPASRMIGFMLVWSGLAVFLAEGIVRRTLYRRRIPAGGK